MSSNQLKFAGLLLGVSLGLIIALILYITVLQNPSAGSVVQQNTLLPQVPGTINLWAIFLTGIFTGGLTCLAVQGGLLAATIAQHEEKKLKDEFGKTGNALPILAFLTTKLIAYTIIGFLLGLLGSVFQMSLGLKVFMQFAVAIFMLGTALNILEVHPIFRYFVIQPPKFLTRIVRNQSKSKSVFAPAILGAFTIFIPCGTTQAMMALSIGSGNPWMGAAVLFAFILGTSPLFFILGYFATKLGDAMHQKFMKIAALALILLAIFNINSAVALTGSKFTLENLWKAFAECSIGNCEGKSSANNTELTPINEATITIDDKGYFPNTIAVKAGSTVKLHLKNTGGGGCIQAFTIPQLGVERVVPLGSSDTITFKAPSKTGEISFMCSMGMYRGTIQVI